MRTAFLRVNEIIVFSFGQTYPLKKGVEGNIDFFLPYKREREREREFEFTLGNGCKMAVVALIFRK